MDCEHLLKSNIVEKDMRYYQCSKKFCRHQTVFVSPLKGGTYCCGMWMPPQNVDKK